MVAVLSLLTLGACSGDEGTRFEESDGGFGRPIGYPRDGGMDGGASALDGSVHSQGTVRVRFLHAIANLGPLTVCHDSDGPSGPSLPVVLSEGPRALQSDFGKHSAELLLPQQQSGALTLHRVAAASSADAGGLDGGASDAGVVDPCSASSLEALIPLPVPLSWREPYAVRSLDEEDPGLLPSLSGAASVTLIGTGLALSSEGLEQRAAQARSSYLLDKPDDLPGAEQAALSERARLESAFGPHALVQSNPEAESAQTFSLSLLHAIPNLTASGAAPDQQSAAVRVCIKAGTRVLEALPQPPLAGVPFRLRVPLRLPLGMSFDPRVEYEFRLFVARDLDAAKGSCANGLKPVAELSLPAGHFQGGRSYTLALVGAVAPAELCSASTKSFVRPGCPRSATLLTPRIELLPDRD